MPKHWAGREYDRLWGSKPEYIQVPWVGERWWERGYDTWSDHYPHVSQSDPNLLSYTESAEKGEKDIQTQIRPGRYLARYFPDLPQKTKEEACSQWKLAINPDALKLATDAKTIQWVYENGPPSCMSYASSDFIDTKGIHPTVAYANSDLAVAYVMDARGDGVSARAVVWPEKKKHSTAYGDVSLITGLLKLNGYEHTARFKGAKLRRIPVKRPVGRPPKGSKERLICPYLDCGAAVADTGDALVIDEGNLPYSTNGVLGTYCDYCNDGAAAYLTDVIVQGTRQLMDLCEPCRFNRFGGCTDCQVMLPNEELTDLLRSDDYGYMLCRRHVVIRECVVCNEEIVHRRRFPPDELRCGHYVHLSNEYGCWQSHDARACALLQRGEPEPEPVPANTTLEEELGIDADGLCRRGSCQICDDQRAYESGTDPISEPLVAGPAGEGDNLRTWIRSLQGQLLQQPAPDAADVALPPLGVYANIPANGPEPPSVERRRWITEAQSHAEWCGCDYPEDH